MQQTFRRMLILFAAVSLIQPSYGQRTIRMNIERIISDAALIFRGTVTTVKTGSDPVTKIVSTFVTFTVQENLYGAEQEKITLKMVGGSTANRTVRLPEMPRYTVGQEIIGMFFALSKSGFTSPVGMGQGTFTVQTDPASGRRVIPSSAEHRRLFSGMKHAKLLSRSSWASEESPDLDAAEFTATVRSLINELKK